MDDLISRISFDKRVRVAIEMVLEMLSDDFVDGVTSTLEILKKEPSVDAVEVVRCKDCKWFGHAGCAIRIVDDSDSPSDSDYCSFGESERAAKRATDLIDRQAAAAGWCIECKEFEEDDLDIHGWCRRRKQMSSDHDSCGLFARRSKNKE